MAKGGAGKQKRKNHKSADKPFSAATAAERGRAERRNTAKQQRIHARAQNISAHRQAAHTAPKVVSLVSAGAAAEPDEIAQLLLAHAENTAVTAATMAVPKQRQRLTLLQPARTIAAVLEAAKAADVLLLVIPADGGLDTLGEQLVDALSMQGVGTVVGVLQGADALPASRRGQVRKQWAASLEARFPMHSKFFALDADPTAATMMRHLLSLTPRPLSWRAYASYVLAHTYRYTPAPPGTSAAQVAPLVFAAAASADEADADGTPAPAPVDEPCGVLEVCGYVRGLPLSIDRAVHVPGIGDVLPQSISVLTDPTPLNGGRSGGEAMMADAVDAGTDDAGMALVSSGKRMTLTYAAEGDGTLGGEQTWPTAKELEEAEAAAAAAAEDDDDDMEEGAAVARGSAGAGSSSRADPLMMRDDDDDDGMDDGDEEVAPHGSYADDDDDEFGMLETEEGETEMEARRVWLERRAAREEDQQFPDEVDTPLDQPARTRFARYRGLKSYRTSTWHPKENLPVEYGKVFHFEQWAALQKHALRQQAEEADENPETVATCGTYVRITLLVPESFARRYGVSGALGTPSASASTLVLCGVNTYEAHLSVLHFSLTLTGPAEAAEVTLKSKMPLNFQCGFRTFTARPIYSDDSRRADKHKLERFVQPRTQLIASVYAPALYAPAPLLAFLPTDDPAHLLLATAADSIAAVAANEAPGAIAAAATAAAATPAAVDSAPAPPLLGLPVGFGVLEAVDADRIILKKIMLTGLPFRCHKKKAVVRWMFFGPEDVRWFRPVELHTKMGRKGAIRESLGTHGYMKCLFDGPIMQHDTVCMALYKRSFPKWGEFSYRV